MRSALEGRGVVRRRRAALLTTLLVLTCCLTAGHAVAAGSGASETKLVNVADTRNIPPGISRWIADTYNDSLWLFGLTVVGVMCGMGLGLGLATDRVVALLGINLGKITHHE